MESVLKIEKLKYKNVLKDITFSLEEKSFNILVGVGGSGKTTLVNCIRGMLKFEGNINIFNININHKKDIDAYSEVGFFLDENIVLEGNLYEELLSLLKNLNYSEEEAKKRIYSIAKKLGISDLLFKYQNELCTYQKTLVSFAFSIIYEPKLLIIDNNLENLDEKTKNKILDYIKLQKNLTTLFITNNSEYFYEADNLLFLKDGKIALSGSLDEVIKNESTLIKCGTNIPFAYDLSNKLIAYELIKSKELDFEKMVNNIWK